MGAEGAGADVRVDAVAESTDRGESLDTLVQQIAARGKGVVMTMGKGGVGKTTIAVRIATELAQDGHR